jgi:predicted tellurium resistance membrane protein TerC
MGLSSLFIVVWVLMLGHGSVSFAGGFLLVMALTLLLSGAHDIWAKMRQGRQTQATGELPSSFSTKELPASYEAPPISVTDSTTSCTARRATRRRTCDCSKRTRPCAR